MRIDLVVTVTVEVEKQEHAADVGLAMQKHLLETFNDDNSIVGVWLHVPVSYAGACAVARDQSLIGSCTKHVNAQCRVGLSGLPEISHYEVSDWHAGGSTLCSFTNGKRD